MPLIASAPRTLPKRSRSFLKSLWRHSITIGITALIAVLAKIPNAIGAGTFYVDAANPSCSETGPGTVAVPYCTISSAVAARGGPATTILVKPAVYHEQVAI